ncbi:hypothetical protein Bp8pS_091 [Bacillus phage vB_BpuM-BpSp]|nr:hypothetical protein Bp8pS_091 [Bacillus phage vB_BpuM-BpSp]
MNNIYSILIKEGFGINSLNEIYINDLDSLPYIEDTEPVNALKYNIYINLRILESLLRNRNHNDCLEILNGSNTIFKFEDNKMEFLMENVFIFKIEEEKIKVNLLNLSPDELSSVDFDIRANFVRVFKELIGGMITYTIAILHQIEEIYNIRLKFELSINSLNPSDFHKYFAKLFNVEGDIPSLYRNDKYVKYSLKTLSLLYDKKKFSNYYQDRSNSKKGYGMFIPKKELGLELKKPYMDILYANAQQTSDQFIRYMNNDYIMESLKYNRNLYSRKNIKDYFQNYIDDLEERIKSFGIKGIITTKKGTLPNNSIIKLLQSFNNYIKLNNLNYNNFYNVDHHSGFYSPHEGEKEFLTVSLYDYFQLEYRKVIFKTMLIVLKELNKEKLSNYSINLEKYFLFARTRSNIIKNDYERLFLKDPKFKENIENINKLIITNKLKEL